MSGNVVSLAGRRAAREAHATCPGCTADQLCYPHRLDSAASRLREAGDGVLLVSADALDDVLAVIDGITSECLPPSQRLSPPFLAAPTRGRARAMATPNNHNKPDRRAK